MVAIELGTGYVSIVSDTRNLARELSDAYQRAGRTAGQAGGREAADSMSRVMREYC